VIDAGRFVTQHHLLVLATGQQSIEHGGHPIKALTITAHLEGRHNFLEVEAGVGSSPVDILADVQGYKKCLICGTIRLHEWFPFFPFREWCY
jgi:hypothetical protein